VFGLAFACQ
jgi:hypothetical protein